MDAERTIRVWDRQAGEVITEKVLGEGSLRFLYGTATGKLIADTVLSRRWVSALIGWYQSSPLSRPAIKRFVREYDIPLDEYEDLDYTSFNQFFVRRFRPQARSFTREPGILPAFAEARYTAYRKIEPEMTFPVKGTDLDAALLFGDAEKAAPFLDGPMLLARLCPVDYHRFHYPDDGETVEMYSLPGRLHSVNPISLAATDEVFTGNHRHVSILQTNNFGRLGYVEVGAAGVGRIVQSHDEACRFRRGEEKGCFMFGGSTVIVMGEQGRWIPDVDLLDRTAEGMETLVRLGEPVGRAKRG